MTLHDLGVIFFAFSKQSKCNSPNNRDKIHLSSLPLDFLNCCVLCVTLSIACNCCLIWRIVCHISRILLGLGALQAYCHVPRRKLILAKKSQKLFGVAGFPQGSVALQETQIFFSLALVLDHRSTVHISSS